MNYEQRYTEALERAKEMCALPTDKATMEYIFPELAESEDERIRKGLIKAFGTIGKKDWGGLVVGDILDWLEKQGKKLDAAEVIEWLECKAFQGWAEEINIKQIVDKFKKDFGL